MKVQISDRIPDPARDEARFVLSGEWQARDREASAVVDAWRAEPWPEGLLSYSIYRDADGGLVRDYSQWTDRPSNRDLPGIVRHDQTEYQLYRGSRKPGTPGAVVVVRVDTDGADLSRTWVDAVFDALAHDRHLPAGGIGAFFHVSTDGTRVLNYAEWESAEAHRRAVAATGRGISNGPLWDKVQTMPGVRPRSVTRFHLYATLTP
ncbi:antibiotic biosynthesis monooxygenase [Couchioplanes caeruleus]|uniref:antibiotic biosynthesis monooxygenase n=1 Tax=Couchioplanes caeruleus TaxID=56438 RepID=UPI0020BF4D64|nr:antibiotic biosynthesis monooxygenase [Couchioplanes caeruleus]UQU65112.1 antibiotic biosynthesis monooxygenase [Couchioplanes caeruleus]